MANALNATLAKRSRNGAVLAGSAAAAMAGMALWNTYRARKVERKHPPHGQFVAVDGTRLHYLEGLFRIGFRPGEEVSARLEVIDRDPDRIDLAVKAGGSSPAGRRTSSRP